MSSPENKAPTEGKAAHVEVIPEFITKRLEIFNSLEDKTPKCEEKPIKVILCDTNADAKCKQGEEIEITAGVTTPLQILKDKSLSIPAVAATLDGQLWDLSRPIVEPCALSFITFEDPRGKEVFWHSSAHVLGASIELELGCEIAIGPAQESGFFYDFDTHSEKIDQACLKRIQKRCETICNKKADYERKMITREEGLKLFFSNKYKQEILSNRVEPGSLVSVYRTGTFIDLCRGPHIINAGIIKAWNIIDISASMWNGQADKPMNRIRAITFPTQQELKEHKLRLEEAAKRDHRMLGVKHNLFFFHEWSPGCGFFYPDGCHIYNKLMQMIRAQYLKRGFVEVITPNLFYDNLFKTSGHWEHYRDDMFHFSLEEDLIAEAKAKAQSEGKEVQEEPELPEGCSCAECCHREMGLKPMNCPGHCLVFKSKDRSYRELPIRMAEFGVLHRNEASGALTGLTRVRRFVQDDAHIFARRDQIGSEIENALDFMKEVYTIFGLEMEFTLSTINMEKYMGDLAVWEEATNLLRQALISANVQFKEAPNEAAFYGPKIDCMIKDCLGRKHQLATVQLDFQLPERFELVYHDKDRNPQRPVMIHRAVLGSLERFIAIAVEHFKARFPFWLSPHQIVLIPQNMKEEKQLDYCNELWNKLHYAGFTVDVDDTDVSMNKKIKKAQQETLAHIILIIGNKEVNEGTLAVRWWNTPPGGQVPVMKVQEFIDMITEKANKYQ